MRDEDIRSRIQVNHHDSSLGKWTEARLVPHPALAPYVAGLWYGEGATFYREDRILPRGAAHLLINVGPPQFLTRHPKGQKLRAPFRDIWISGPQTTYLDTESPDGTALVGVAFHPYGAFRFFGVEQHELASEILELSDLIGDRARSWKARVQDATTPGERIARVEAWLLDRLGESRSLHPVVPYVVDRIASSFGRARIGELTKDTGFSRMHLSRLFLREVGLTPKRLARVHRFHATLRRLESGRVDWSRLALECGYYDQPHLSRDFRAFAGRSPEDVLKASRPDDFTLVLG